MSNLKRALVIKLLWTQSRCHGGLIPPNKAPTRQKLKYETLQISGFRQFSECQPPAQT